VIVKLLRVKAHIEVKCMYYL